MALLPSQSFNILLIEDEIADAGLIKAALKRGRFLCQIHHVRDGVEALNFLRKNGSNYSMSPNPDLIFLDLNMPRMDGREFLKEMRSDQKLCTIPVVVLTTSDTHKDVISAYSLGANSFVTKPMGIDQLMAMLHGIEEYWFSIVRLPRPNS
ncbi:Response regulator Rcp1 [Azospirillaceae bacterium]